MAALLEEHAPLAELTDLQVFELVVDMVRTPAAFNARKETVEGR